MEIITNCMHSASGRCMFARLKKNCSEDVLGGIYVLVTKQFAAQMVHNTKIKDYANAPQGAFQFFLKATHVF